MLKFIYVIITFCYVIADVMAGNHRYKLTHLCIANTCSGQGLIKLFSGRHSGNFGQRREFSGSSGWKFLFYMWGGGFWVLSGKLGFVSGLVWNTTVVSGLSAVTYGLAESEMDDLVGPKPPSQVADMETWISAGLSTSCHVSVSGRNSISGTTFPPRPYRARDLVTMAEVGSARLTSLERVTTGVGSVSRAARAKPNSLGRSVRPTLRMGYQFLWLLPENMPK